MKRYIYTIDLNERGYFKAHVENILTGNVVHKIVAGAELEPGDTSIFEDGFMKHPKDIAGLQSYLKDLGIIESDAVIVMN